MKEILVYGGFDNMGLTTSFVIRQEEGDNNFECDVASTGDLQNDDIFLFTGAFR